MTAGSAPVEVSTGGVPPVVAGMGPGAGPVGGAGALGAGAPSLPGGGTGGTAGSVSALERGQGPGTLFEIELESPERAVLRGKFSLYVPDNVAHLNGVIVHQHGCGRSGITLHRDLHWQALANRWGMALMGTEFPTQFPDGDHCERWSHVENGSEDLFITALARLAADTRHPELLHAPWVLWGHSGGASWAFQMAKRHAAKVVAVVLKSICEQDPAFDRSLTTVPFLLATGPADLGACYPITTEIFRAYRSQGAPWAYVDEPDGTHECLKLRYLAIPYLDAMAEMRLVGAPTGTLNPVDEHRGVLGEHETLAVSPADSASAASNMATWLPNADVGRAWREFLMTRGVSDSTPPVNPPAMLSYQAEGDQARLRWSSEADLESGILGFHIYQGEKLLSRLPDASQPFQGYNYGDEPEPVAPEMTAVVPPGHTYRVTSVNGSGLESSPSEPAIIP